MKNGITLHDGGYYCINCVHSFRTEKKLKSHENLCKNHDYSQVKIPEEFEKTLKYTHGQKSIKIPFIIYADTESLLEKRYPCDINPKKSSATKISKYRA